MADAPANAWTGHHLLSWLQAHPQWLDRPVHLLLMTGGEEDAYLTTAEEDQFEPGNPNVISLIADGPAAAVALPAPLPAVGREVLAVFVANSISRSAQQHVPVGYRVTDALLARYDIRERGETAAMPDGAAQIAAERRRVVTEEGRTLKHDDQHVHGELLDAARCYVNQGATYFAEHTSAYGIDSYSMYDQGWPWWEVDEPAGWKPSSNHVRNLVKAGQFIAAEIDRLQRAERGDQS